MCIAPTKPLSCRTTEFALKLYKIDPVFWTILDWDVTTFGTNQLFWIVTLNILSVVHNLGTIFSTSKVRVFTLKAQKICVDGHCIFTRFIEIWRIFIYKLVVLFAFFEFQSFSRHFLDSIMKFSQLYNCFGQLILWRDFNPFFAKRTHAEIE